MRTRAMEHLLRSALGLALLVGVGFTGNSASAQDGCTPGCDSDCHACEGIYQDAGLKLREYLDSVCDTGCCDDACCDDVCCDDVCCDGCGCDWCCLGDPWSLNDYVWDGYCGTPPFHIGGWTQFGVHSRNNGMFNNLDRRFHLHQGYLYAEKVADGRCGLDWGWRGDVIYGIDGQDTAAFGGERQQWDSNWTNGNYAWAIPQLYAEFAVDDTAVKVGKFYTIVGYEVVTAPDNFFYSHAYTMYNSEPFTHTGLLASQAVSDEVTVYGGWVDGWDTGFEFSGGSQFIGGASVDVNDDVNVTYVFLYGRREIGGGIAGVPPGFQGNPVFADGYNHSVVVSVALDCKTTYILQSDWVDYNDVGQNQFGVNQYLLHWYNDCLGFGMRAEWWHTSERAVFGTRGSEDLYQVALGMNIKPHANLIVRPEVRWDWDQNGAITNPGGNPIDGEATFGVDAILTF